MKITARLGLDLMSFRLAPKPLHPSVTDPAAIETALAHLIRVSNQYAVAAGSTPETCLVPACGVTDRA